MCVCLDFCLVADDCLASCLVRYLGEKQIDYLACGLHRHGTRPQPFKTPTFTVQFSRLFIFRKIEE